MTKIFYDHLVVVEEVTKELDNYDLDMLSRQELIQIIDETLHQEVINLILTHLPEDKHEDFLNRLYHDPSDDALLEYLKKHSGKDIEKLIKDEAKKIKADILAEIKKSS